MSREIYELCFKVTLLIFRTIWRILYLWIEIWLKDDKQNVELLRMEESQAMGSSWDLLGLILFTIFVADTEKAVSSKTSEDANDTKLFYAFVWQTNSEELEGPHENEQVKPGKWASVWINVKPLLVTILIL